MARDPANSIGSTGAARLLGHPALMLVCRVALAVIFLYAGLPKVAQPAAFLLAVRNYAILPDVVVPPFALVLPMLEVVAGALLLLGVWIRPSALTIGALLLVFIVAIASALARGIDIECGCFSHGASRVGLGLIARDVGMLAMVVPLLVARRQRWALWPE